MFHDTDKRVPSREMYTPLPRTSEYLLVLSKLIVLVTAFRMKRDDTILIGEVDAARYGKECHEYEVKWACGSFPPRAEIFQADSHTF